MSKQTQRGPQFRRSDVSTPLPPHPDNPLAPIYDKAQLIREELESLERQKQNSGTIWGRDVQSQQPSYRHKVMEVTVNRDSEISKMRETFRSQQLSRRSSADSIKRRPVQTSSDWRQHTRYKTSSLVHFLAANKDRAPPQTKTKTRPATTPSKNSPEDAENFEPVGQQFVKEKLYQESLKSQTHSLVSSSRFESNSMHSSRMAESRRQSSGHNYLRKGSRVRQIMLKQFRPDTRGSGSSAAMTYIKEYDQWVPSTLVQTRREELETFLNMVYGGKRAKEEDALELDKVKIIYL